LTGPDHEPSTVNKYQHQLAADIHCSEALGKIVCVGRNYAEHAKELNNPVPRQPLLFIKPSTAAVSMLEPVAIPRGQGACHHELEMSVLIVESLTRASSEQAVDAIGGIGLALDLTLRDLQSALKQNGQPWERAKAFDGACPLSPFVSLGTKPGRAKQGELQQLDIKLYRNGLIQQAGNTTDMLFRLWSCWLKSAIALACYRGMWC
jgi:2-keto-4-pentenoate hydratase/2-oxohepta-3-ene-1,7-dioic acid hydratase in catechol pathway